MHVEDRLQEVYFKSRMLSEYLKVNSRIDLEQLAAMLGSVVAHTVAVVTSHGVCVTKPSCQNIFAVFIARVAEFQYFHLYTAAKRYVCSMYMFVIREFM